MPSEMGLGALLLTGVVIAVTAQARAASPPLTQQWVRRFHGDATGDDGANDVAVDNRGNVFVTGYSITTNGYPDYNFVTLKYSSLGLPLWTNYYDGTGHGGDDALALALDRSGKVFVTGFSANTASNYDYATIAYSNNGLPLWTNRFNGPANDDDEAEAITVDTKGNVYVTGFSLNNSLHYVTIKYSNAGLPLWTNSLTASPTFVINPRAFIALGRNGMVVVAGTSFTETSGDDYIIAAYSSAGAPLWTNHYNGPGNQEDHLSALATDKRGNVYVTGSSFANSTGNDYATIAYSSAGKPLWTNRFNGPGNGSDMATAITVDSKDNVYVAGDTPLFPGANPSYGIVAYSSAGIPLWTNFYTGATNEDEVAAIATEFNRGIVVTGASIGSGTGIDYATIEYSLAGVPLSTNRYNGPANDSDTATAIAIAQNSSVIVTGLSIGTNGGTDIATIKYAHTRTASH